MNTKEIQRLLDKVFHNMRNTSASFSIFEMLKQSTRELTHSAFIGEMLNPNGIHGRGAEFLDLFLSSLPVGFDFLSESATVEIEKDFGSKRGQGKEARGGRIDIFIKDSTGRIIVIENKIYAVDQIDQLQRYKNEIDVLIPANHSIILYLTLDGHKSANCPDTVKYHRISYKKHIIDWLEKCQQCIEMTHPLHNIISQYMDTIKGLTSDQEIIKIIQSSSSNLKASLQIARLADKARNDMKKQFLVDLAKHLSLSDNEIDEPGKDGKEWQLHAKGCDWCIEHNLFIRFNKINGKIRQYINSWWQKNEHDASTERNWIYIKIKGDKINLHDFNVNASAWLDDNTKETFWAELDIVINKIESLLENK